MPFDRKHCVGTARTITVLIGMAMAVLFGVAEPRAADPQNLNVRAMLATLEPGEVTANHGEELVINNVRYSVLSSATVTDDEGNPRNLKEFIPGIQVRFHLKKGSIDQLVLMLPR